MSHSNTSITIHLMENTANHLLLNFNYIVNMTQVKIVPYTNGAGDPSSSAIVLKENDVSLFSSSTYFTILQTSFRNLSIVSSIDEDFVNSNDKNILLYKTSLVFENVSILSEYLSVESRYIMISAVELQEKFVYFSDLLIQISGGILYTVDPIEIKVTNVVVDMYKAKYGIRVDAACNYPEAVLDGGIYCNNVTFYDSTEKETMLSTNTILYSGPGHLVLNNITLSTYLTLVNNQPNIIMWPRTY